MRSVLCNVPRSGACGMAGNPAMMVDPWGLDSNPLMPNGTPLLTTAYFGSTAPQMPNVIDGIRKAQGTTKPSSYAIAGSERFAPDWLKKQGKTWSGGFVDAFTAEANEALDGIKNAPEAVQEAVTAFLNDPGGFIGDLVKAGLSDFGELLGLIELRSNPKHPYDAGQRNGKLAFRALGFLGGAGLTGLAARAPKLLKLLKGKAKKVVQDDVTPPFSRYDDVTAPRSRVPNRATNVSKAEFQDNLAKNGWTQRPLPAKGVFEYSKDGARFVVRDNATSTGGTTADFYPKGSVKPTLKIRLDQGVMP